jgi:hypothetical protein
MISGLLLLYDQIVILCASEAIMPLFPQRHQRYYGDGHVAGGREWAVMEYFG